MARSALLNVMVQAVRKAGRGLARDFGEVENLQVSMKGPGDFVSAADKRAAVADWPRFAEDAGVTRASRAEIIAAHQTVEAAFLT